MSTGYEPKTLMGTVFGAAGTIIGVPLGALKGGRDATQGGSFAKGAAETYMATYATAAEFGDKHGGKIVSRLLTGILIGLGADISHHFHDHDA